MKSVTLASAVLLSMMSFTSQAATVDGYLSADEYQWNTNGTEGSSKWETHGGSQEVNDGSGGDNWDISFLGTNVENGNFQFGVTGGQIISGRETGSGIYLGDFALDVNGDATDPTTSSTGFDYAIRLLDVNDQTGEANFALLTGGDWQGADIYNNAYAPQYITETYRMENATTLTTFVGSWMQNGGNDNVLEGEFDLSLLGLFDENFGGVIATYLTMACVNDEAMVYADVAPVPVPAALWLFAPALMGFVGLRRRKTQA